MLEWVKDNDFGEKQKTYRRAGFVDDELLYISFRADVNISNRAPTKDKEPVYDDVEKFIKDWRKSAPDAL